MPALELSALAIVALWLAGRARAERDRAALLSRLGAIAGASFLGEDTMIRAYGFYAYSPRWSLFLDQVPLLVVLIWPVVIHSAWDLARHLCGPGRRGVPLLAAALVLADASLIEPISVRAGLWAWTEPGPFAVPPVGVIGWAVFAFFVVLLLERGVRLPWLPLAVPPTHLVLVAAWWGALRWVNGPVPAPPVAAVAWAISLALAALALARRARDRVPVSAMLLRAPAAAFFFVLLGQTAGAGDLPLVVYAIAFAPPYLCLMRLARP